MKVGDLYGLFKKKRMYEMLQSIVDTKLAMMKNASYRFYRGSEWLECESDGNGYMLYKIYHAGYFVSLNVSKYIENEDNYMDIDRITFRLVDDKLVKEYQRSDVEERKY